MVIKGSMKESQKIIIIIKLATKNVVFERHVGTWKYTLLWGFSEPTKANFKDRNTDGHLRGPATKQQGIYLAPVVGTTAEV